MPENIVLIQALAELAYSISMADGELQPSERKAFEEIIISELGKDSWSAKNRFAILQERITPNVEQSYKFALFAIRTNKKDFSESLRSKFINVIQKVADASDGLSDEEKALIDRFKEDIKHL
jgi:uncharacterized tellurite resistance protein B-like protein